MHETEPTTPEPSNPSPPPAEPSPEPSPPEPSPPEPEAPAEGRGYRTAAEIDAANRADTERLAKEHARERDSGTGVARSQ